VFDKMQWQLNVSTRLNLEDKTPKVITDLTGVLSSDVFVSWLIEKKINFKLTNSITEMISLSTNQEDIAIITTLLKLPTFISNKFRHYTFNFSDIPLNGDVKKALSTCDVESIINLLDYVFETDRHKVIQESELLNYLEKTIRYKSKKRISTLIEKVTLITTEEPNYENVLILGSLWGELIYLSANLNNNEYKSLISKVDGFSEKFIIGNGMEQVSFASTPKNPMSVDKILPNIKSDKKDKIALLCFDCMGYAEWYLLKDYLKASGISFEEKPIFTMLPSVTSISRSAIFQGNTDVYNLKSPGRKTEEKGFATFFNDKQSAYLTESDLITENTLLGYNYISILYTFFDELGHSTHFPPNENTKTLYFAAVNNYLKKTEIMQTLETLQSCHFNIYICSDHGSVIAFGNGQKLEKYLIDNYSKRAVIVPVETNDLISQNKINIPFVNDKIIVLPEGRTMFTYKDKIEVNHGGITVEEIVVPYIKII
jgi:hypothetical protein